MEKGVVTLIGATTENPSFEVISALLSRCQVYVLEHLQKKELISLLHQAIEKDSQLQKKDIKLKETDALLRISGVTLEKLLNIFEVIINTTNEAEICITDELVKESSQQNLCPLR